VTRRIVFRDEARAEFDHAFDTYEAARPGVGVRFAGEVGWMLERIRDSPELHPVVLADVRKAVVRRFPYAVFYRSHVDRIEVLAVYHARRDPSGWQDRA
jgi:plasmid stabilization system protein ParE